MDKKGNKLFGFFGDQIEVQEKIEELRKEGYSTDDIYVIAKDNEHINKLHSYSDAHFSTGEGGDWIDKFNKMFTGNHSLKTVFEEMGFSRKEVEEYNQRIDNGEIFLFADDDIYTNPVEHAESSTTDGTVEPNQLHAEPAKMSRKERRRQLTEEEESMLLHEEQLEIHKERVQTGQININKRIVEEQQQMDIPVERDDVFVERRPVHYNENWDEEIKKEPYHVGDELHIPVVEERLVVTKKEVVTEEIIVTKKKRNETEHITETIRREEVDIKEETDLDKGFVTDEDEKRNL